MSRWPQEFRDRPDWQYSYSQLEQFSSCGEKYRIMKMIEERPQQQPAAWLVHGNAFHNAAEMFHQTAESMADLYLAAWDEELARQLEVQPDLEKWVKTPRVKLTQTDLDLRKAAGLVQCEAYEVEVAKDEWNIAEFDDQPAVELAFELEFQTSVGKTKVRGKIDQLRVNRKTGEYEIVDLKTGAAQEYKYRQLGLYGLAVREMFDVPVTWGRYWYSKLDSVPKSGDKLGRYSPYIDLTHFDREYWTTEFDMMEKAIRAEIFLPNPGDQCGRCDAAPLCRAKVLGY